jgi:lipoprotein-releasing system ATP-binding protein
MGALLEIAGLTKRFRSGAGFLEVLRGVDLALNAGEFVAVVGPSGAGKSTLLHILGALDRPDGGTVAFRGVDIFAGRPAALDRYRNREVGFVFQFHHLMPEFTALENVMMPALVSRMSPAQAAAEAQRLLELVGLAERSGHRPGQLSGGEQQRVAVARALVMSPSLLLADEPTGNLDAENSAAVFELLRRLGRQQGLTVAMVTHNRELAEATDRILTLTAGRVCVAV